jgi:hypothetical protein
VLTRPDLQHAAQLATHAPLAPSEYGFALPALHIIYVEADRNGVAMENTYYHELRHIEYGDYHVNGKGKTYLGEWPAGSGWQWWE